MTRKFICLLLLSALLACCFSSFAESGAASGGESQMPVQTTGIDIPVFSAEETGAFEIPDNEAMKMLRDMKCGWNLGNTFDAFDVRNWFRGPELEMEAAWVHAITTKELISALKNAGFNTIRIPSTWYEHVDENNIISEAWLKRVKEVAGWALDEGMYVIVNVHHDDHYKKVYMNSASYEQTEEYLSAVWKQLAETFRDCDEHLILESMNEPRPIGHQHEWWLDESCEDCRDAVECINQLNQKFVDVVRSTGGNNTSRYLLVPGHCGSPEGATSGLFRLPEDSAENRIMVEVHAYRPYPFALQSLQDGGVDSFSISKDREDLISFMDALYNKYISKGVPVVIDEFGARKKGDNLQDRVNCLAFYTAAAKARGIPCCVWDNHVFSGNESRDEFFGIIDRNTITWKYPDIALAIIRNSESQ